MIALRKSQNWFAQINWINIGFIMISIRLVSQNLINNRSWPLLLNLQRNNFFKRIFLIWILIRLQFLSNSKLQMSLHILRMRQYRLHRILRLFRMRWFNCHLILVGGLSWKYSFSVALNSTFSTKNIILIVLYSLRDWNFPLLVLIHIIYELKL